jgi:hypothetical protein
VPKYENVDGQRQITGTYDFTVTEHDGHNATLHHPEAGSFTLPKDSVKHFSDDLNQITDVPEHPSNAAINTLRNGQGTFLGKGDDGLVYDTHDGNVAKVTTVVPYNLQNFRHHTHAIADARRQAEINNQAYNEGHDVFLPQQFEEHGEKGFTIRPKLEIGGSLSPMQIAEYREKMQKAWDAGWRINDSVQHGVDPDGRIRVYDTGKMTKVSPSDDPQGFELDDWGQRTHARKLMSEHGHYDEQSDSEDIRDFLDSGQLKELAWYNSQHEPKDKLNPLETFAPSQWKNFTDAIYGLIKNESEELAFHVDDIRALLDDIESQVKATRQTQPAFTAKTNDENADFWITRKGSEKTVGTPHKDFREESIGITVDKNQLDPAYAFYLFQHVKDNLKFWEPRSKGTLNLKNITLRDVKELAKQVAPADTKPVPKGYERILPLQKAIDKYESETANRVLDKRLLNAQAIFDNLVTEYQQYDDDDLPHGESLDGYIYDKELFAEFIPDLDDETLAQLAFAAYRTGVYHNEDNLLLAGFEIDPAELLGNNKTSNALRQVIELQKNRGLNERGQELLGGESDDEEDYYSAQYAAEDDPINPDNLTDGTEPEPDRAYKNLEITKPTGRKFEEGFGSTQTLGIPNYTQNEAVVQPEDFKEFDHKSYMQQPISKNDGAKLISDYEYHLDGEHSWGSDDEENKKHYLDRSHIVPDLFPRDSKLQELYKRVHRADNDHPDEENDEYYYHVTQAPNAATYLSEDNLQDQDPAGFNLIEKKNLRYWLSYNAHKQRQYHINRHKLAYEKEPLEEGQERLQNKQAAEHFFNWEQAAKSSPLDFDDIQVHRIPKSKIQPYVATEYKYRSLYERQYPVFTSNTHIKQRVREAREAIGKVQKMGSDDRKELDDLSKEKTRLEGSAELHRNRTQVDAVNLYDTLRQTQNFLENEVRKEYEGLTEEEVGFDPEKTDADGKPQVVYALYGHFFERDENGLPKKTKYEILRGPISKSLVDQRSPLDVLRDRALMAGIMPWDKIPFEQEKLIPDYKYNLQIYDQHKLNVEKKVYGEANFGYGDESGRQAYERMVNAASRVQRAALRYDPNDALALAAELDEAAKLFPESGALSSNDKRVINDLYQQARDYSLSAEENRQWRSETDERRTELLTKAARNQLEEMQLKVASNPEYHRWAGNNKAVDEEGLPLIIFHGTSYGGFGEMAGSDVEGHVYGSTNVDVAASYTGGRYTDDITPVLATSVEDIASSLANSHKYQLLQFYSPEKGMTRYAVVRASSKDVPDLALLANRDKLIPMVSEDELIVRWNQWISESGIDARIGTRGVYPLVFRINNPLVVEGGRSNWHEIPVAPSVRSLDAQELLQVPFVAEQLYGSYDGMTAELADDLDGYFREVLSENYFTDEEIENSHEYKEFLEALDNADWNYPYGLAKVIDMAAGWGPASDLVEDIFEIKMAMSTREWAEYAEQEGHDGIIFQDITDMGSAGSTPVSADVFVAFGYENVKSAHNIGTFEEETPRGSKLLYSAAS